MSSATSHLPSTARPRELQPTYARAAHLRLRLVVALRRYRLDRMLAAGAEPTASRELALRAGQLTAEAHRNTLADGLEKALTTAECPRPRLSSAVPLATREVLAARPALLALCRALRDCTAATPAGVALTQVLLTDGSSPLYLEPAEGALEHALRHATAVLQDA
jgi:hypothetical protein